MSLRDEAIKAIADYKRELGDHYDMFDEDEAALDGLLGWLALALPSTIEVSGLIDLLSEGGT